MRSALSMVDTRRSSAKPADVFSHAGDFRWRTEALAEHITQEMASYRQVMQRNQIGFRGILDPGKWEAITMLRTVVTANADIAHQNPPDLDETIARLTGLLRLNPKDAEAYKDRGVAYMRKGRYVRQRDYLGQGVLDKAIADFTRVIWLRPEDANAYFLRGTAHKANGNLEKAIADFTAAIRINPKNAKSYIGRSVSYRQKGDANHAKADKVRFMQLAASSG